MNTKNITGHACGGMFYVLLLGKLWFLVQDYVHPVKTHGKVQTKFPLGKGKPGETIDQTFNREMGEEVLEEGCTSVDFGPCIEFRDSVFVDDEQSAGGTYEMRFNLLDGTRCPGVLRTGEKQEVDSETELGEPYLLPVNDLIGGSSELHRTHRLPLAAAILHLVETKQLQTILPEQLRWCHQLVEDRRH